MSNRTTKTTLSGLAILTILSAVPSLPASAQEAIMLETQGFVRMVQPDEARQAQSQALQPKQSEPPHEKRQASAF